MRRRAGLVLAFVALGACSGGGGSGAPTELEPVSAVVDIDPCTLLPDEAASELVGAEVERASGAALARAVGCSYSLAGGGDDDSGAATGRAVASLLIEERDEATTLALHDAVVAEANEDRAPDEVVQQEAVGDGGVVIRSPERVEVRYVVRTVVVTVEILPVEEVEDELVTDVVDLAIETVEPVKEAVDRKPFEGDGAVVPATANIYLAQGSAEGDADGTEPIEFDLADLDAGDELGFEVSGSVDCCDRAPGGTADGVAAGTSISGVNGLGGYAADRQLALVGLFLGDDEEDRPAPPGEPQLGGASRVEAELGVPFLIGDGLDDDGEPAVFEVPAGATRLLLGFVDGAGFGGTPGSYDDNRGAIRAAILP